MNYFLRKRKFVLAVLFMLVMWLIVLLQLNSFLMNKEKSSDKPIFISGNSFVTINFFKKYYLLSIQKDNSKTEGENGKPVKIRDSEKQEKEIRYNLHKFNELASSKISLTRSLPEKRRASCFTRKYPIDLPTASIIIIYHNEAWSTLLRTVHTALSRSPYHLIKEVILVDDFSDYDKFPYLLNDLDDHFKNNPKVIIIRSDKRIGLTVARLLGAERASGDVLIFLDSHCETLDGWIEPLLLDIKENPTIAVTPIIEIIDLETFAVTSNKINVINVGTFTWKMDFTWYVPKNQDSSSDMLKSPTMAGGLFAIGRKFFFDIGSYDNKMTYWGSENLEMSFRLWTCANGIFSDPCSIVGHVFRSHSPHKMAKNAVLFNKLRMVEVWTDDYKLITYSKIGVKGYNPDAGSLEERITLRKQLGCKSFKWYLENVATEVRIPGKSTSIKNLATNLCFDADSKKESNHPLKLYPCHSSGGNQAFEVDYEGYIIFETNCLDLSKGFEGAIPVMYNCHFKGGNQKWKFEDKLIRHEVFNLCAQVSSGTSEVNVGICDKNNPNQQWEYEFSKKID